MLVSPKDTPSITGRPRLAILASGNGSNFEAICAAVDDGSLTVELCGLVYNKSNAYVADRAQRRGIPTTFVNHRDFASRETFDKTVVEALRGFDTQWIAMAGWMRVATPTLLDAFADRVLNIHPSLLPSFRGLNAVEQALDAGVRISGCTVHIVRPEVDEGPIIAQAAVVVESGDSVDSLQKRIHAAEHALYPRAIALAIAGLSLIHI